MDKWLELGMKKRNKEITDKWNDLAKDSPFKNGEHFRKWVYDRVRAGDAPQSKKEAPSSKESVDIHQDGSQSSHRLLRMTFNESKDPEYLLKAHGYSVDAWELVSARSNIWNAYSKQDGVQTLYSSRITVKPRTLVYSWDSLVDRFHNVPTVEIEPIKTRATNYLNIPLFDMHFGIADYEYYKGVQSEIAEIIKSGFKEILFVIGQDMFHNDDFRGRTARGTQIQRVDMEKAWDDAMSFYLPLIELSLKSSREVKIVYSKGNHDESMSWAFVKGLEGRYPQIKFDTYFRERKAVMLGKNFVGINHGDKKRMESIAENFATEFPLEWSRATTREVFTGDLHHEKVLDKGGLVLRRMPTGAKTDDWHDDYGYTTAHKRFEIFEYTEDKVSTIHYI